ncbi:DUF3006 domain-containing protein [bacterium]|nr:DUF3006 domain-containing protein [bacterium]
MEVKLVGFIDRIEGDYAVVKADHHEILLPIGLFTKPLKEGYWLEFSIKCRPDLENKARDEVLKLLEELQSRYKP